MVSTIKSEKLTGISLFVVEVTSSDGTPQRLIAADATCQAGVDHLVYLIDSMEGSLVFRNGRVPCDYAICGFLDHVNDTSKENDH